MTAIPWSQLTAVQAEERAVVAQARAKARWAMVSTMPSTNVRIVTTISLVAGTFVLMAASALLVIIKGAGAGWEPSIEWLGFLGVLGGIDVAQFGTKRTTDSTYVAAKVSGESPPNPPSPPKPPEIGT